MRRQVGFKPFETVSRKNQYLD